MPEFTGSQKKAHDARRHISMSANAGSGKTSVLVSRFCDLLEFERQDPNQVAAITFTEKAAAELRVRIAGEIERRLAETTDGDRRTRLKRIREALPNAALGTIHGFCSSLLREFPIEFDVSPTFRIVSGYERIALEEEAIAEAIERALEVEPEDEFSGTYDTVRRIGRETFVDLLRLLIREREKLATARSLFSDVDRDDRIDTWSRHIDRAIRSVCLNAETQPLIRLLIDSLKPERQAKARTLLETADRATTPSDFSESFSTLLTDYLLTSTKTLRKRNFVRETIEESDLESVATMLAEYLSGAFSLLGSDATREAHELLLDDSLNVVAVADLVVSIYAERKDELNVLDFDDLQLRIYERLDDPAVIDVISRRFSTIMVDEFQDTNELQYRIVHALSERLEGSRLLCVVGDPKQSIYGFRGAEVEVFKTATLEIRGSNRSNNREAEPLFFRDSPVEPSTRDERLGELRLEASFRLLPALCAFVNLSCRPLMPSGRDESPAYDDLVCARRSEGTGSVEVLLVRQKESDDDDDSVVSEGELIARRIAHLVESDSRTGEEDRVRERDNTADREEAQEVRYGDIAILCRKRSQFPEIESALRDLGVPYASGGGFGYFATQEVLDVVGYLRVILNHRDDVALLGLLRSPFFAVSDAELYTLSRDRSLGGADLWDRIAAFDERNLASEQLRRAVRIIDEDRGIAGRLPVSLLMKRIVDRTGWRGAVVGAPRGEQMLANLDKLIDLARTFERRGFTNLYDFVERIEARIDADDAESEAVLNDERDAVRLLTMHGAKGLEFPVVILPGLDSPPRKNTPPFLDRSFGLGYNWTFNRVETRPAITALMAHRSRTRELAEEARLFYVAMTRARDMLILSGSIKRDKPPPRETMLAWALAPFDGLPEDGPHSVDSTLPVLETDGTTISYLPQEIPVVVRRTIDAAESTVDRSTDTTFDSSVVRVGNLPARARGEIYSATAFQAWSNCPTRYYVRYRLGIPESVGEAYGFDPDRAVASEDGLRLARLFRSAAVRIDEIDGSELARLVADVLDLEPLGPEERSVIADRLLQLLRPLVDDPEISSLIEHRSDRVRTSFELRMAVEQRGGAEFVLGVIDRVIEHPERIRLIQYRTLSMAGRGPDDVLKATMPQLRLYAWLLSRGENRRSIDATVLLADHPELSPTVSLSNFDLLRFDDEIAAAIEDMRSLSYTPRHDLPTETPHCPLCPYHVDNACILASSSTALEG